MPLVSVAGLIPNRVDYSVHGRCLLSSQWADIRSSITGAVVTLTVCFSGSRGAASFPVDFYVVDSIDFDVSIYDECENLYARIFHLPLHGQRLFLRPFCNLTDSNSLSSVERTCTPPMHGPSAPVEGDPRSSSGGTVNNLGYEHGEYSLSSNAYQFSAHGESGTSSVRYGQRDVRDDVPACMAVRDPYAIDGTLGEGDFRRDGGLGHSAKPQDESGPSGKSKSFAVNVLQSMLFQRGNRGMKSSLFSSSRDEINTLLRLHGLDMDMNADIDQCRSVILGHVLLGQCFHSRVVAASHSVAPRQDVSSCMNMAWGYISGKSLSLDMLRTVLSYSDKVAHLSLDKLYSICQALDYKGGCVRSRMLAYLETMELRVLQSSTSSNNLVNDMSTPVLYSIAHAYHIPLHSHIGIVDLKKAVQEHFEECVCMVNERMGTSIPPAPAAPRTVPDSVSGGGMGDRKWLDEYLLRIDSVVKRLGQ